MYRRLASIKVKNAGNSHDDNSPSTYEMLEGGNSQPTYSTVHVQSEASAPAPSTSQGVDSAADSGRTQPLASPSGSSDGYMTPIDNYSSI